jgi:transcriptional regulator with PAS, ATPase and Fis domain
MADKTPPKKGRPRGSGSFPWRAFFQHSTTPVFVLGGGRRLRYANPAWEKIAGVNLAGALGMVCSARRHSSPLAAALAPSPEAMAGKPTTARRPAPGARPGTQWWDISFAPLAGGEGLHGMVGFIAVVGEAGPHAARKLPASLISLRERHAAWYSFDLFADASPLGERFTAQLRHAANSAAPVWFIGEPGSGKETAARVVHHGSNNRDRSFVALDCGGLQPFLIEGLLFGHGGLLASGHIGTLFLKDPAALPRDLQQRLADFAAESQNAPRLISGSNHSSADQVSSGRLVAEFHSLLSVLEVRVPPLRERVHELPRIISRMLPEAKLAEEAIDVLRRQPWPGNLRELAGALGAASSSANGGTIRRDHLPRELRVRAGLEAPAAPCRALSLDPLLEAVEKRLIELALRRANNHQTAAAELLGIFRARLWRRLEALGIPIPPQPAKPRKNGFSE